MRRNKRKIWRSRKRWRRNKRKIKRRRRKKSKRILGRGRRGRLG